MESPKNDLSLKQAEYYGSLYEKHGVGVDAVASGRQAYKNLRYEKLSRLFSQETRCSVHDVGFGLGHFHEYLKNRFPEKIEYSGSEVTPQFVEHCRRAYPDSKFFSRDLSQRAFPERYDYLVFGGTFYHPAEADPAEFETFMRSMLLNGFASASKGIAFNLITSFVETRYPSLFYPDICQVIQFVAKELSRFFTIDHATPLYEYTVCVYREGAIAELFPDEVFDKYFKCRK